VNAVFRNGHNMQMPPLSRTLVHSNSFAEKTPAGGA
jgi:hypothetical protein